MATDLTTQAQRDEIIENALRRLRIVVAGASGTSSQVADAAHALDLITKYYDVDPKLKMFHNYSVANISVSANDLSGSLVAGVLTVEGAYYKQTSDSSIHTLKPFTFQEYIDSMAQDSTAGTPEYYYVSEDGDRAAQVTMFFYPKIAADGTVYYWSRNKIALFGSASGQSDFPDSWARLLVLRLTADLAWEYGKPLEECKLHEDLADKAYNFLVEQQVQNTDFHKTDQPDDNSDRRV